MLLSIVFVLLCGANLPTKTDRGTDEDQLLRRINKIPQVDTAFIHGNVLRIAIQLPLKQIRKHEICDTSMFFTPTTAGERIKPSKIILPIGSSDRESEYQFAIPHGSVVIYRGNRSSAKIPSEFVSEINDSTYIVDGGGVLTNRFTGGIWELNDTSFVFKDGERSVLSKEAPSGISAMSYSNKNNSLTVTFAYDDWGKLKACNQIAILGKTRKF